MKVLSQFKNNLMGRVDYEIDVGHDKSSTPKRDEIIKKLAEFFKVNPKLVKLRAISQKYGFPKSRIKASIYESEEGFKV